MNNTFKVKSDSTIVVNGLEMEKSVDYKGYVEYTTKVQMSKNEVVDFYEGITKVAFKINYCNDPFNWAAFAEFKIDDEVYTISSPLYWNGDNNWYAYSDKADEELSLIIKVSKSM